MMESDSNVGSYKDFDVSEQIEDEDHRYADHTKYADHKKFADHNEYEDHKK